MGVRRSLRFFLEGMKRWLDESGSPPPSPEVPPVSFDNRYEWLGASFLELMRDPICARRPQYIWGVLQGAALGKVLGMQHVSVMEFGVAGGAGLISLEQVAGHCEKMINIEINVYGFDTGIGLPKPEDYSDCPQMWSEGYYPGDMEELAKRLRRAHLKLGLVKDTVPAFLQSCPPPIAFAAFDLDFYSSTKEALNLFDGKHDILLPRIACFFRGIMGKSFSDYTGERLAISEFNDTRSMRKLSPIYGLKYFVPREFSWYWPEMFYFLHNFDHPLYNAPDSLQKSAIIDIDGNDIARPVAKG